jgi:hypothetical protein
MRLFHETTSEVPYLEKYVLPQLNPFDDKNFRIRLTPVGVTRKPVSPNELTAAVKNICSCLFALHDVSYVHCNIRWPNIIEYFDKWIIIDCEYACLLTDAKSLPDRSSRIKPYFVMDTSKPWSPHFDLYQVGLLLNGDGIILNEALTNIRNVLISKVFIINEVKQSIKDL